MFRPARIASRIACGPAIGSPAGAFEGAVVRGPDVTRRIASPWVLCCRPGRWPPPRCRSAPPAAGPRYRFALPRPWSRSFGADALPARPVFHVLHLDAESLEQLLAELVARGVDPCLARGLSPIEHRALVRAQLFLGGRALLQREPEHAVHVEQHPECALLLVRVDGGGEVERLLRSGEGLRRIEVVRERVAELARDGVVTFRFGHTASRRRVRGADRPPPPLEAALRRVHSLRGEVEPVAVTGAEREETKRERVVTPADHVVECVEPALRLRHPLVVDAKEAHVQPVAHERLPRGGLGLRDLALVMRKEVILATRVKVECVAKVLHGHGGALDVPARVAPSPRRIPLLQIAGLRGSPQREVRRVTFVRIYFDARPGDALLR